MMKELSAQEYVKSGQHLPPELRDFHDQKLLFKWLVWEKLEKARSKNPAESALHAEGLNWVNAHVFTVDYFLWFMGMFGYTLQRSRKKGVQFYDLSAAMDAYQRQLTEEFHTAFSAQRAQETSAGSGEPKDS